MLKLNEGEELLRLLETLLEERSFNYHFGHVGLLEGKMRVIDVDFIKKEFMPKLEAFLEAPQIPVDVEEQLRKKVFLNLSWIEAVRDGLWRDVEKLEKKGKRKYKKEILEALKKVEQFDKEKWIKLKDVLAIVARLCVSRSGETIKEGLQIFNGCPNCKVLKGEIQKLLEEFPKLKTWNTYSPAYEEWLEKLYLLIKKGDVNGSS